MKAVNKADIKKVVLAYSGGLDTSIIIPWLKENYNNCEVIAVSGNVGQADELEGLEEKALKTGASKLYVLDLTEDYVDNYIIPTMQAGAVYEDYLLGTSHARPCIAKALVDTNKLLQQKYPLLTAELSEEVYFLTTQQLADRYPDLTPKERENAITKEHHTVFLMQIGGALADGKPHDGRAPDYDDWSTIDPKTGLAGLNGDLLVWNDVLDRAMELSSMGIRVNKEAMLKQLELTGKEEREKLYFHRRLLKGSLPLSIGGGIGQSRLCMLYLKKAHIGEIQASIWPEDMRQECSRLNMPLI